MRQNQAISQNDAPINPLARKLYSDPKKNKKPAENELDWLFLYS